MPATLAETLKMGIRRLTDAGFETANLDARILLTHVLNKPPAYLYAWPESKLTEEQKAGFDQLTERRLRGEPTAYIIGQREFWSIQLSVDPRVLIPRPETELIVERALVHRDELSDSPYILDLCTGSGALAIALAHEFRSAEITATDMSEGAIQVAQNNAQCHAHDRIHLVQADLLNGFASHPLFDLIVCNPPYIEPDDPHLDMNGLPYEPVQALVSEPDGLAILTKVCAQSTPRLRQDGWLIVEHGFDQGHKVRELFHQNGFSRIRTHNDLNGQERVTEGCFRPVSGK